MPKSSMESTVGLQRDGRDVSIDPQTEPTRGESKYANRQVWTTKAQTKTESAVAGAECRSTTAAMEREIKQSAAPDITKPSTEVTFFALSSEDRGAQSANRHSRPT